MPAYIKNIAIENANGERVNHEVALNHKIAIGEYMFDGTVDIEVPDTALGGNRELTLAEYQALSEEEKMNGLTYYITDVNIEGNIPIVVLTKEEYDALGDYKYTDGKMYLISDDVGDWTATGVTYDNTNSGLTAINVGAAIDELAANAESLETRVNENIGTAIDELDTKVTALETSINENVNATIDELETKVDGNTESINTLNSNLNDCFQSVSNGKSLVASAITDKGVTTASDATFNTMAENIGQIPTGKCIYLGTGTSFNIQTICANNGLDYTKLTNSNFIVGITSIPTTNTSIITVSSSRVQVFCIGNTISHSYNSTTGVLTISGASVAGQLRGSGGSTIDTSYSTPVVKAYLVYTA